MLSLTIHHIICFWLFSMSLYTIYICYYHNFFGATTLQGMLDNSTETQEIKKMEKRSWVKAGRKESHKDELEKSLNFSNVGIWLFSPDFLPELLFPWTFMTDLFWLLCKKSRGENFLTLFPWTSLSRLCIIYGWFPRDVISLTLFLADNLCTFLHIDSQKVLTNPRNPPAEYC